MLDSLIAKKAGGSANNFVWGAGAKGITFTNALTRRGITVRSIIDINPSKQNKFAALTGIPITAPDSIMNQLDGADIFIMNPIYAEEISETIRRIKSNLIVVA